jgi:hypothetical protein
LYYYGARYYGDWIARFISVDPLQHKYPHYTPYQYAGNKPVTFIDLDGGEEKIVIFGTGGAKLEYQRGDEGYETAKSLMYMSFTSKEKTEGYQWEMGYKQYTLDREGDKSDWSGPETGTLIIDAIGDKIKIGYDPAEPQRPAGVSLTESVKSALHAIKTFTVTPDPNVEGSEEFQKAVMGYFSMVGGAFAMEAAEPYLAQGALKAMEYSGEVIDAMNELIINNIDFYNGIAQISSVLFKGPDPVILPGEATLLTESFKLLYFIFSNKDEILKAIENVMPERKFYKGSNEFPIIQQDNTNYQRPEKPVFNNIKVFPSANIVKDPPILKTKVN